ncbi:RusA family crossover junction endodeoxyribonuclease [Pararhodobacter marinus]|uniref:RusA family crossover junction endodeoxyribonuclease n=1 Tax=Pararhodobacter marinus TaxID=2184063 RepID=A0A2U2C493_9RHOB|nr:RusA family crossover junction endodeoxyribonuclease [Pararhodobacter marinus]PWE26705.1 RusA family crossover junction endodeoxyribonuclease [Pararhodobacter marinus]
MTSVQFTIPGKPFGKQRARATARGGFARMYTPKETVSFERSVGTIAAPLFARPITGPVRLRIIAVFEPAASWSKKKRATHLHRPHTQKPDLDNVAKAIKDGLNRIAWADDSQVADLHVAKLWGIAACTQVWVEPMTEQKD